MSVTFGPPQFKNRGDWLIWRSTGIAGDFRMPICTANILNEGLRDGWAYQLTDDDIRRILARYKEHVSFWNITIEVIRAELDGFAKAVGRDYMVIATLFDSLPPKRIVREL